MSDDVERRLEGLRFRPRPSLGPEIVGRVRRGEAPRGGAAPRFGWSRQWWAVAAACCAVVVAGAAVRWTGTGRVRQVDQCCRSLDGGPEADDGYVVRTRGRTVEGLTLYEDRDGDGRFSGADRVLLLRGASPGFQDDSVAGSIRVCCSDLDGEGPADDGLLVLNGTAARVVLAGIFEQRDAHAAPPLR